MTKSLHLLIHGRVQGVGYRAWMVSRARELGLNGWVRNRREGTVEAAISGEAAAVAQMLADCHEGPMAARVDKITQNIWTDAIPSGFQSQETV